MHQRAEKGRKGEKRVLSRNTNSIQLHRVEIARHAPQANEQCCVWHKSVHNLLFCSCPAETRCREMARADAAHRMTSGWMHREQPTSRRRARHPICGRVRATGASQQLRQLTACHESKRVCVSACLRVCVCRPDAGLRCIGPALAWPECSKASSVGNIHEHEAWPAPTANRGRSCISSHSGSIGSLAVEAHGGGQAR